MSSPLSAPQSSAIGHSPPGWASIAPLTKEGHLWACRSLLSVEFFLILKMSSPLSLRSSVIDHLPCCLSYKKERYSPSVWDLILRDDFSALQSSLLVELALLPSPRGSPMSMPLLSENLKFSTLQSSESVDRSKLVGRASTAPLTVEGHLWACRSLLSVWDSPSKGWVVLRSWAIERNTNI